MLYSPSRVAAAAAASAARSSSCSNRSRGSARSACACCQTAPGLGAAACAAACDSQLGAFPWRAPIHHHTAPYLTQPLGQLRQRLCHQLRVLLLVLLQPHQVGGHALARPLKRLLDVGDALHQLTHGLLDLHRQAQHPAVNP